MEKSDDRMATIVFKRGLYIYSPLSQKLNKRKYDYTTLEECFDIADNLTDWDDKSRRQQPNHITLKADKRNIDRDTPFFSTTSCKMRTPRQTSSSKTKTVYRSEHHHQQHPPQYRGQPFFRRPKRFQEHLAKKNPDDIVLSTKSLVKCHGMPNVKGLYRRTARLEALLRTS